MANLGQALAAAVNGGLAGYRMSQDMKDRADDQAWQKEQRDMQRDQLRQQRELRAGLADAVKPVTAQAVKPLTTHDDDGNPMPAPGLWQVNDRKFGSEVEATTAAAAANTPDAQAERIGLAYMKAGMPEKALGLADAQLGAKIKRATLADSEQARKRDDMFRDVTTRFARGGWAAIPEIYQGYDDGNTAKVEEDGKGGATVVQIGADGKEIGRRSFATPMDFLSGQVASLDPKLWVGLENQRATQARQVARDEQTQRNQDRQYELSLRREERQDAREVRRDGVAERRDRAADVRAVQQERLRVTDLFKESGKRILERQRALATLQQKGIYSVAKPGSPQHQELQGLKDEIADLQSERKTYQQMLAGLNTGAGPASAPRAAGQAVPAEREAEGIAIVEQELARARAEPATNPRRAGDIAAIEKELASRRRALTATTPSAGARAPAAADSKPAGPTDFSHLWK